MARDENLLKRALELVKPEFKAELEKVMKKLAVKWDSLSEDQHEDYYWGDGTISFVFDDNEDSWKALPSIEELANSDDTEELELEDCILDYICPFEGGKDEDEDENASDKDAFNQTWDFHNYAELTILADVSEQEMNEIENYIYKYLESKKIKFSIDRN